MKIRTLIVDDEPLARERLQQLLMQDAEVEVLGQCASGLEAYDSILELNPDLVFLDIQMPELDGFGLLDRLREHPLPAVIFVTAHDKFALKAFEVHALDYLLKPFDRERFQLALKRAKDRLQVRPARAAEMDPRLAALLSEIKPKPVERLAIKGDGRIVFVKTGDIDWVEACDNYVNLHVGGESHLLRETMASLENKLSCDQFLRISRSTIVNVERIKELQPLFHGDYSVLLRNGTKLTLSRNNREKLQKLLGKLP